METAQNPAPEVTQPVIRMVPRSELYVPDWNPRKYKNESEMQDLMAFMKSGRKPPGSSPGRGKVNLLLPLLRAKGGSSPPEGWAGPTWRLRRWIAPWRRRN